MNHFREAANPEYCSPKIISYEFSQKSFMSAFYYRNKGIIKYLSCLMSDILSQKITNSLLNLLKAHYSRTGLANRLAVC